MFAAADAGRPFEVVQEMGHQLANMAMLYVLIGLLNKRARTAGNNAARQACEIYKFCLNVDITFWVAAAVHAARVVQVQQRWLALVSCWLRSHWAAYVTWVPSEQRTSHADWCEANLFGYARCWQSTLCS